jgi:hypothetical protein
VTASNACVGFLHACLLVAPFDCMVRVRWRAHNGKKLHFDWQKNSALLH